VETLFALRVKQSQSEMVNNGFAEPCRTDDLKTVENFKAAKLPSFPTD
jgi:hypothetical protein